MTRRVRKSCILTDAIQVQQQKASWGQEADTPTGEWETKRVHTEVWLVEPRFKGLWHHMLNFSLSSIVSKGYGHTARC
jgi:hypothetical protein